MKMLFHTSSHSKEDLIPHEVREEGLGCNNRYVMMLRTKHGHGVWNNNSPITYINDLL